MAYEKKDWQRSEGRLKSTGKESREKEKRLRAYRPSDKEKTKEKRPNELMAMESSYGGVAFGSNRNRKMTMVVHEKRRSSGLGLKKDNLEVEGNRTVSLGQQKEGFRTNSHSRQNSALVFSEALETTPLRMLEQIQEMMDHNNQKSGEQILPFLNQKKDAMLHEELQKALRQSLEKKDAVSYQFWSRKREHFLGEQTEKEQMRKNFYKELLFAHEKSKRLIKEEPERTSEFTERVNPVNTSQDIPESEDENLKKKGKNVKK